MSIILISVTPEDQLQNHSYGLKPANCPEENWINHNQTRY